MSLRVDDIFRKKFDLVLMDYTKLEGNDVMR